MIIGSKINIINPVTFSTYKYCYTTYLYDVLYFSSLVLTSILSVDSQLNIKITKFDVVNVCVCIIYFFTYTNNVRICTRSVVYTRIQKKPNIYRKYH